MQIKTTIYDIVGYLIPGSVFIFACYFGYSHSTKSEILFDSILSNVPTLEGGEILLFVILAYLLGHLLSSISFIVIEGVILKAPIFNKFKDNKKILGSELNGHFCEKFKNTFGFDSKSAGLSVCIAYVESKQPEIYSTAMIFQSFYGMARNLSFIFLSYSLWELVNWSGLKNPQSAEYFLVSFILGLIAFYHYLRFLRYFRQRILTGFAVP